MLLSTWLISGALLIVQSAVCSDVKDNSSVNRGTYKEVSEKTETYNYNHPPEVIESIYSRKENSINVEQQNSLPSNSSRGIRRRTSPKVNTESVPVIPVQIIYDTETTTPRLTRSQVTSNPVQRTTRTVVQRRRNQQADISKKIDIRQTTIGDVNNNKSSSTERGEVSSETTNEVSAATEFPKRSRGSYFKKRTGTPEPRVKIIEEKNFVFAHSGNFHYSFLGGDGTKISSEGALKSFDSDKTGEAVSGSVFYKDKDGNNFSLSYTADENGYRPVGAHLPTPPPLPPAIARALKYIADKSTPSPSVKDDVI